MFTNYIFIIIVLLVYGSYSVPENIELSGFSFTIEWVLSSVLFILLNYLSFRFLKLKSNRYSGYMLDKRFHSLLNVMSVSAVFFFSYVVYGLHIKAVISSFFLFKYMPVFLDLTVVSLFIGYISTVWIFSWQLYTQISGHVISRKEYLQSNLMFLYPVILVWFLLGFLPDLISLLPFDSVAEYLKSDIGYQDKHF